jgi:hypothetical protein
MFFGPSTASEASIYENGITSLLMHAARATANTFKERGTY